MSESWNPPPPSGPSSKDAPGSERRSSQRFVVEWPVDCVGEETFLYAAITDVSQLGIFVACKRPLKVGTMLTLSFSPTGSPHTFTLPGRVQWVNEDHAFAASKHPGMGVVFVDLSIEDRERIVEVIHTIAYLRNYSN